jgi:quercetin dioxygenase-like cupin family protein
VPESVRTPDSNPSLQSLISAAKLGPPNFRVSVLKSRAMRAWILSPIFFLFFIFTLATQTVTEVEITAEPSHHLVIDNEYVRVFKVEVAPHAATLMHRHRHDYVFVTLGAADISNEVARKSPVELKLADGDTHFSPGNFAHVARNLSDQPFRNVTIELLQDRTSQARWPTEMGEQKFRGGYLKILFIKDGARVSETYLEPGAMVPSHHHNGPHLTVAVTDLDLRSDVGGGGSIPIIMKAGDVKWVPGNVTHTVTNTGTKPARLVSVEF